MELHGDESPEFCEGLKSMKIIKAIRIGQDFDLGVIRSYPVDMVLLDSNIKGFKTDQRRSNSCQSGMKWKKRVT